jgi:hypothetical protein
VPAVALFVARAGPRPSCSHAPMPPRWLLSAGVLTGCRSLELTAARMGALDTAALLARRDRALPLPTGATSAMLAPLALASLP